MKRPRYERGAPARAAEQTSTYDLGRRNRRTPLRGRLTLFSGLTYRHDYVKIFRAIQRRRVHV